MDNDRIARNLACVEKHFHSEAVNEVEAALDLYSRAARLRESSARVRWTAVSIAARASMRSN
jgi:hypothetical protein